MRGDQLRNPAGLLGHGPGPGRTHIHFLEDVGVGSVVVVVVVVVVADVGRSLGVVVGDDVSLKEQVVGQDPDEERLDLES